jgi:hypothetical protein
MQTNSSAELLSTLKILVKGLTLVSDPDKDKKDPMEHTYTEN